MCIGRTQRYEKEHDNDQLGEKSVKKEQKCIWTYDIPFGAKIGLLAHYHF